MTLLVYLIFINHFSNRSLNNLILSVIIWEIVMTFKPGFVTLPKFLWEIYKNDVNWDMTPVLPLKICWKDKRVYGNSNIQFISLVYVSVARQNNIFTDIRMNFCLTSRYLLSYYIYVSRNQIFIEKFDDILKYQKSIYV